MFDGLLGAHQHGGLVQIFGRLSFHIGHDFRLLLGQVARLKQAALITARALVDLGVAVFTFLDGYQD